MKTRNNIYHDLSESVYITKFNSFKFSFSSKFYQHKFESELVDYIKTESDRFKNRYNVNMNLTDLLAFTLYRKIEKRGCFVRYNNGIDDFIIKNKMNFLVQIKE